MNNTQFFHLYGKLYNVNDITKITVGYNTKDFKLALKLAHESEPLVFHDDFEEYVGMFGLGNAVYLLQEFVNYRLRTHTYWQDDNRVDDSFSATFDADGTTYNFFDFTPKGFAEIYNKSKNIEFFVLYITVDNDDLHRVVTLYQEVLKDEGNE